MPYKLGRSKGKHMVMVQKNGKWKVLKVHKTKAQAIAHLRALRINVKK